MKAPRRLVDDPSADSELSRVLRESGGAQPLDDVTRRRLNARLSRAVALPAAAAGWVLFLKSAGAALGAVGVAATVATVTGVVDFPMRSQAPAPREPIAQQTLPQPQSIVPAPVVAPPPAVEASPEPVLNPVPSLPSAPPSASGASLAAESTLLEQARREMRRTPAVALQIAAEHAKRYPRGQLASERTLIEVEALHRLGRSDEARGRAQSLLRGQAGELYRERVRKLLGEP